MKMGVLEFVSTQRVERLHIAPFKHSLGTRLYLRKAPSDSPWQWETRGRSLNKKLLHASSELTDDFFYGPLQIVLLLGSTAR